MATAPTRSVVTIGNFDGVHRGHQRLVAAVVAAARRVDAEAVVVTFDPHPVEVLRPTQAPPLLTTLGDRVKLLREHGVDRVVVQRFTPELSLWDPPTFVGRVLAVASLGTVEVQVGENFRFGHRASGDVETLTELGEAAGFRVTPVALAGDGTHFSSTAVRGLLARGDVQGAHVVLGRPHRLPGALTQGGTDHERILLVPATLAVPDAGSYRGRVTGEAGRSIAVTASVGAGMDGRAPCRAVDLRSEDGEELPAPGHATLELLSSRDRGDPPRHARDRATASR